jgi:hypothetical protein
MASGPRSSNSTCSTRPVAAGIVVLAKVGHRAANADLDHPMEVELAGAHEVMVGVLVRGFALIDGVEPTTVTP